MGPPSTNISDKKHSKTAPSGFVAGAYAEQGLRPEMEDEHFYGYTHDIFQAAIYDGHGGKKVSQFLIAPMTALHDLIYKKISAKKPVKEALMQAYAEIDNKLLKALPKNAKDGATAVNAVFLDDKLYVANIGDAEAIVIGEDGKVENMTYAHKAYDTDEKKRIEDLGGHVFFDRLFGSLAVSRAFGDFSYKTPNAKFDFVSSKPFIKSIMLNPTMNYVVLACDGLWDVMTHDEVAKLVMQKVQERKNPQQLAKLLVDTALAKGSTDNVSVIVIKIHW